MDTQRFTSSTSTSTTDTPSADRPHLGRRRRWDPDGGCDPDRDDGPLGPEGFGPPDGRGPRGSSPRGDHGPRGGHDDDGGHGDRARHDDREPRRFRRCGPHDGDAGPGDRERDDRHGPRGPGDRERDDRYGARGPGGFGPDGRHGGFGPRGRHEGDGPGGPGFGRGTGGRGRGPGGPRRGRGPGGRGPGGPGGGRGGDPELPGFLPPGARVGRGDIRAGILVLLLEGPMHGYQLIHELHERSGHVWRPSPGSVYPTLKRLSAEELISSDTGEGRGHRRAFSLTDAGTELATRLAAESTPWEALVDDDDRGALELRDLVVSVIDAARQVVRVAEPAQAAEARTVLVEARRRLYGILAAEPNAAVTGSTVAGSASDDGAPTAAPPADEAAPASGDASAEEDPRA